MFVKIKIIVEERTTILKKIFFALYPVLDESIALFSARWYPVSRRSIIRASDNTNSRYVELISGLIRLMNS